MLKKIYFIFLFLSKFILEMKINDIANNKKKIFIIHAIVSNQIDLLFNQSFNT